MIDRVRRGGDEGAALILAIIYVLVVSVVVMSVVDYAGTGVRSSSAVAENRDVDYALDAAVDGAVRQVRHGLGAQQGIAPGYGGVCDNYNAPTTNGLAVTVSCQGEQGVQGQYDSGGVSPAVNADNVPPVALQTTANTGEPGISLDANGNYRIHGSVQATSSIRACTNSGGNNCSSGTATSGLLVGGSIKAQQCIGDIRTFGPPYPTKPGDPAAPEDPSLKDCPGGVADPVPAYMPNFSSPPPTRSVPACPSSGWLVTLEPGTYDNAAALNALTAGSCNGKILWFKPGEYLFKFPLGAGEWRLADATVNVIGGTPFGWSPTAATRPTIPKADNDHPARHACVTEYDALPSGADPNNLGVVFVFTGESRVNIAPAGGNLELCSQPSSTGQQIALFGMPKRGNLKSGTLGATSVTSSAGTWTDLGFAGLTIDGLAAPGSTPTGGSATVSWEGFNQLDATTLPDDSVITRVVLKVAHHETSTNGTIDSVTASVRAADGTLLPAQTLTKCTAAACTDTIDLTKHLGSVAKLRTATGQTPSLAFTLTAASGKVATEALDAAALDVYWVPKAMTASSATASPATNVLNVTNAVAIDGAVATTNTPASNTTTTTTTLAGYSMTATDLPSGAQVTKVLARVAHKENAANVSHIADIKVAGTAADGSAISGVVVPTCITGLADCTATVDLTSSLSSVGKLRNSSGGGPTLTYAVKGKNSGTSTSDLDGVRLEVTYAPDALGTAQGCIAEAPYSHNDGATCAVLRAQGNNAFLNLHGTLYATSSAVDLKVANGGTTVFGRGALVRTLRLFFNPSVVYSGENITIETPDYGTFTRHDRIVDFWACAPRPDGTREPTCDDTNAELHVVGVFNDATPGTPVTFKLWSHRRQ